MKDPTMINDYYIRLTGKANIPEPLEIGHNYQLRAGGTVTSKTETDKNDGSHVEYFKYEPVVVEIITDAGESIKAKDTRSGSQLFRSRVWAYWNKAETGMEFNDFYDRLMEQMIHQATEIIEMYGGSH